MWKDYVSGVPLMGGKRGGGGASGKYSLGLNGSARSVWSTFLFESSFISLHLDYDSLQTAQYQESGTNVLLP